MDDMNEMEEKPESRREKLLKEIIEFFGSLPDDESAQEKPAMEVEIEPKEKLSF